MRKLIRADGTVSDIGRCTLAEIKTTIGADTGLDSFVCHDRVHVLLVDDLGQFKNLPPNMRATALYFLKCGGPVQHVIVGDAVLVPDADFADNADAGFTPPTDPEREREMLAILGLDITELMERARSAGL